MEVFLEPHFRCFILISVPRIEELSLKLLGDLIQLSSYKYEDVIVAVFSEQAFPQNVKDFVPLEKNRMIVLNGEGQVFANGECHSIFDFLEVGKERFT